MTRYVQLALTPAEMRVLARLVLNGHAGGPTPETLFEKIRQGLKAAMGPPITITVQDYTGEDADYGQVENV